MGCTNNLRAYVIIAPRGHLFRKPHESILELRAIPGFQDFLNKQPLYAIAARRLLVHPNNEVHQKHVDGYTPALQEIIRSENRMNPSLELS